MASPLTGEEHQDLFAEFVRLVRLAGGATPHMLMVAHAAKTVPDELTRAWMGGCYAATYNYAAGEALWQNLAPTDSPATIAAFVHDHWSSLPLRRERKAVNSPDRLARCLSAFAGWAMKYPWHRWGGGYSGYEGAWKDFLGVWGMGRYVGIRWLEFARLALGADVRMPDIRPIGGEYPRQGLSLLYPDEAKWLNGGDDPETIQRINLGPVRKELARLGSLGMDVDHYTLQSLLCEYKQAVLGGKQWPGKSLDSELLYWDKVYGPTGHFDGAGSRMYEVRGGLFPGWALGEVGNKWRDRKVLGPVLRDHGYLWSDAIYDWEHSRQNLAHPVRWVEAMT